MVPYFETIITQGYQTKLAKNITRGPANFTLYMDIYLKYPRHFNIFEDRIFKKADTAVFFFKPEGWVIRYAQSENVRSTHRHY